MNTVSRVRSPFQNLASSRYSGLDSLFDRVFGEDGGNLRNVWSENALPLSIWQDENSLHFEADLPGVEEKDLEITIHNDVMTLKAQRKVEEGRTYLYNGRTFGSAERVVTLPADVDSSQVEANLQNGVLRISLPKLPQARPRKIAVKTS